MSETSAFNLQSQPIGGLFELLNQGSRRIAIVSHQKPDGDSLGSSLGLASHLREAGHAVAVLTPDPMPDYLTWLPDAQFIRNGVEHPEASMAAILDAEIVFCLDFGLLSRTAALEPHLLAAHGAGAVFVNLDHHMEYGHFAHFTLRDVQASSTCELVYRLIRLSDAHGSVSRRTGTCLYVGLNTDTNSFRNVATSAAALRMAADLLELGVPQQAIIERLYNSNDENRIRFRAFCLSERLTVLRDLRAAYITVSRADKQRFGLRPGDTEGLVNDALGITGINFGALIHEEDREDVVKFSFRSTSPFSANSVAHHFGGGGHFNAAAARVHMPLMDAERALVQHLMTRRHELEFEVTLDV